MVKNIVLQHKLEKEKLLSKKYIHREKLNYINKFLDTNLIKVITGPRRAGKSVFCMMLLKEKNFAYINFDDESLLKIRNYDEIIKAIFEVYSESKYILFDEIQNLAYWEVFVNKLQRRGFNLILTGSNAKLLSKELATSLTGRHLAIELLPFSFKEYLKAKNFTFKNRDFALPEIKGKILNYLDTYLKNGGFPEIVVSGFDPKPYLETLFDAILLKDVVKRYKVKLSPKIYDLATYLIANFSCEYSFTRLKNILGFRSVNTIQNYLKYLEEAYLFFSLNRFSFKVKEQIKTAKKIYVVDNGFILAKAFQFSQDLGKLLENLVFIEMIRKGYKPNKDIYFYKTASGKEVDFILRKGVKIDKIIQVSYSSSDLKLYERELKALIEAGKELRCDSLEVITWDESKEIEIKKKRIRFVPLYKFLFNSF